jgi:hypothetical protein
MEQQDKSSLQANPSGTFQMEVPVEGNLALLALGDIGLLAWRAAKQYYWQMQNTLPTNEMQPSDVK